jgi:hypothetical protein
MNRTSPQPNPAADSAPHDAEADAVLRLIAAEPDVQRVVRLARIAGGRFRYLIETPFATFPKFVIGTTDAQLEDVRREVKCGAPWNAESIWAQKESGVAA